MAKSNKNELKGATNEKILLVSCSVFCARNDIA